jgi:hypothetical protein
MNTGKMLENLVEAFERLLTPAELNVEINDKVFNDEGIQIAEFDIIISGDLGSSSLRWLIECRDRPSQGAAPLSWIEQLYGRRAFHNFDKVFAVSTTGFAPGAVEKAKQNGIILRTVDSVSDIASGFRVFECIQIAPLVDYIDYACFSVLDYEGEHLKLASNAVFKRKEEENYRDMIGFALQNFTLPEKIDEHHIYLFSVIFREPIDVFSAGSKFTFVDVGFTIRMRLKAEKIKTLESVRSYQEDGRVIGQEVNSCAETPAGKLSAQFLIAHKSDGTHEIVVNTSADDTSAWTFGKSSISIYKHQNED